MELDRGDAQSAIHGMKSSEVIHRFGDEESNGIQVQRSHWGGKSGKVRESQTFGHKVGTQTFLRSFSLVINNSDGSLIRSTDSNKLVTFSARQESMASYQCIWPYFVRSWHWPFMFWPQNLNSSSLSSCASKLKVWWNSPEQFTKYWCIHKLTDRWTHTFHSHHHHYYY